VLRLRARYLDAFALVTRVRVRLSAPLVVGFQNPDSVNKAVELFIFVREFASDIWNRFLPERRGRRNARWLDK
jgi:hypothetical protein